MARVNKFASVNLNDLYGKKEPAVKPAGNNSGSAVRPRVASHGGMLVLTRPVKQQVKLGGGNLGYLKRESTVNHSGSTAATTVTNTGGWTKNAQLEAAAGEAIKDKFDTFPHSTNQPEVYTPPGSRCFHPLSASPPSTNTVHTVGKTVLLRGEEFPTLQASLAPVNTSVQQQRVKDSHQKQKEKQLDLKKPQEELQEISKQTKVKNNQDDFVESSGDRLQPTQPQFFRPPQKRGNLQAVSGKPEEEMKKRDGPLFRDPYLISLNHASEWTDDERANGNMTRPGSGNSDHRPGSGYSDQIAKEAVSQPRSGEGWFEREVLSRPGLVGSRYERDIISRPCSGGGRYEIEVISRPVLGGSEYARPGSSRGDFVQPGWGGGRYEREEVISRPDSASSDFPRAGMTNVDYTFTRPTSADNGYLSGKDRHNSKCFPHNGQQNFGRLMANPPRPFGSDVPCRQGPKLLHTHEPNRENGAYRVDNWCRPASISGELPNRDEFVEKVQNKMEGCGKDGINDLAQAQRRENFKQGVIGDGRFPPQLREQEGGFGCYTGTPTDANGRYDDSTPASDDLLRPRSGGYDVLPPRPRSGGFGVTGGGRSFGSSDYIKNTPSFKNGSIFQQGSQSEGLFERTVNVPYLTGKSSFPTLMGASGLLQTNDEVKLDSCSYVIGSSEVEYERLQKLDAKHPENVGDGAIKDECPNDENNKAVSAKEQLPCSDCKDDVRRLLEEQKGPELTEEEQRKQNARKKLLELEERIAKREAEKKMGAEDLQQRSEKEFVVHVQKEGSVLNQEGFTGHLDPLLEQQEVQLVNNASQMYSISTTPELVQNGLTSHSKYYRGNAMGQDSNSHHSRSSISRGREVSDSGNALQPRFSHSHAGDITRPLSRGSFNSERYQLF
eukprot:Gb_36882 [translate_table: standard]